jgi:hypothetical protein
VIVTATLLWTLLFAAGAVMAELGGVKSVDATAAANPGCNVTGCIPMSASRFTVAC